MICERCGMRSDNSARICPHCGAPLRVSAGTDATAEIRQGRSHEPPPVYGVSGERPVRTSRYAQDAGRPENHRGIGSGEEDAAVKRVRKHDKPIRNVRRRGVNRALLLTVLAALLLVAAVVLFVLAIRLPQGHLILMRATANNPERQERIVSMIGEEAAAQALWQIGSEQIDQGYIAQSIETYTKAYELAPEIDGLYQRLLSLADAYEAIGSLDEAEALYQKLYTEVDEQNPLAYRYAIDILTDQGRLFEATDLMQLAYDKTGELSFKSQRESRVPLAPVADKENGRYMNSCLVTLSSPQGYDVYYLLDDAETELPEGGMLFSEPLNLTEGTHEIRAVCVSSELISDEVNFRYTVWFPVPSAPKSRLLTGVYDNPKRVYLYMEDIKITGDTPDQQYVIYYTIDGTQPNSDSPIYTSEGFMLPVGRTTLRAVAVNQYGKVSNEYVGTYKINGTPQKLFSADKMQFKAFTLGKSTYENIRKLYGAGQETGENAPTLTGRALRVNYEWGSAWFTSDEQVLYAISTNNPAMIGPQGSKVGMRSAEVTALYRDCGQAANAKGNRSLYSNSAIDYGRYWKDSDTAARIEYACSGEDDQYTVLTYHLENDTVTRIDMTLYGLLVE